jgi:hypothetical protein
MSGFHYLTVDLNKPGLNIIILDRASCDAQAALRGMAERGGNHRYAEIRGDKASNMAMISTNTTLRAETEKVVVLDTTDKAQWDFYAKFWGDDGFGFTYPKD